SGWLGELASAAVPTALRGDADILPDLAWAGADTQVDAEALITEYQFAQGEEALREDRRLMYVAVSRARRRLLLNFAARGRGLTVARPRSRDVAEATELPPEQRRGAPEAAEDNPLESARPLPRRPPAPGPQQAARARAQQLLARAAIAPAATSIADEQ